MAGKQGKTKEKNKTESKIKDVQTNEDNVLYETITEQKTNDVVEIITETPKTEQNVWKPDLTRQICVKNISRGKLIYKSKRQLGYMIEWSKPNETNYMELGEFINLKNSDLRFITSPWIRIVEDDEIEILRYANILKYYEEILGLTNISDIFSLSFENFKKKFSKLPEGYKNSVVEQAAQMIKNGELDSIKIKNYLEETMEIELDILTGSSSRKSIESVNIS